MCLRAAIRRPLRSKRAMISPVRLRANASGLTRMRVRSMNFLSIRVRAAVAAGRRWLGHDGLFGGAAATAAARGGRRDGAGLGLAVGAQLPRRVDRLAA